MIKGDLYCKACFLKVFKEKGSYASFGVKTLPNWKPGQTEEGGSGSPAPASPAPDATTEAKAAGGSASPPPTSSGSASPVPAATSSGSASPAPAAAAGPPGINLSSSDLPNPKCKVCLKTVYDQEKQVYDKTVWHIACFKCLNCKRRIDVKGVAMISGDLYCKPCFMKVFKEKGNYSSFGPKTLPKWEGDKSALGGSGPAAAPETPPPASSPTPEPTTPSTPAATEEPAAAPAADAPAAAAAEAAPAADVAAS